MLLSHEKEKKREFNRRIMNIEHGTVTPLLFSVSEVLGSECFMFHKHMAQKKAEKFRVKVAKKLSQLLDTNYHL